ncbi:hypothetical protein EBH_0084400 [Eimeria brunetti]|uniref:Uncharacterized protein n=1 Tax=Eimeria brunetti TaxID=51314 RepID=U6M284_9EIME|nr:hypothetical protein EBH_0084400 [Eimeria brunetti]
MLQASGFQEGSQHSVVGGPLYSMGHRNLPGKPKQYGGSLYGAPSDLAYAEAPKQQLGDGDNLYRWQLTKNPMEALQEPTGTSSLGGYSVSNRPTSQGGQEPGRLVTHSSRAVWLAEEGLTPLRAVPEMSVKSRKGPWGEDEDEDDEFLAMLKAYMEAAAD